MKKITIISLVLLAYFSNLTAQETDKKCKFKLSGFGIEASENTLSGKPYTYDAFKSAYSDLLFFKTIDSLSYNSSNYMGSTTLGGYLSFSPITQKHKYFSEIRFGLSYNRNSRANFSASEKIEFKSDTLVNLYDTISNNPWLQIIKDSNYSVNSSYNLGFQDISISALYLFKTNPDKRFSGFAGLGLEVGRTMSSYISEFRVYGYAVSYITSIKYPDVYPNPIEQYEWHKQFDGENTKIANSTFLRATLPVGVSMRFSKKDNLCGKMSMSLNARFGLDMIFNPDLGTNAAFFRGWALGFKCSI